MDKKILIFGIFLIGIVLSSGVFAYSNPSANWQSYQPTFDRLYSEQMEDFWPILNQMEDDQCEATSDFVIGIPPGGCTPTVVRSDLLEEQNVPVFCQLYAIKINPLIKVSSIKSISFKNKPEGVSSVVFHPARAAVKSYTTLLGDPMVNNIGYVVIILKREKVEENMAEWIAGNLTATIRYDAEEAYGTGAADYYLPLMGEEEWDKDYAVSSFWNGRGYLRTISVSEGRAKIQVLTSKDKIVRTFDLKEGETSGLMYLPGYYCRAGLKVKLNDIVVPEDKALLNIDGQMLWVRDGTKFLNGKCSVTDLKVSANNEGNISIRCSGAGKIKLLSLTKDKSEEVGEKEYVIDDEDKKTSGLVEEYFEKSRKIVVDELVETYGTAEKENGETFGEEALYEQIVLAGKIGKMKTKKVLMGLFIKEYPSSRIVEQVRYDLSRMNGTNYSDSFTSVYVVDKFRSISVVDFRSVNEGEKKVDLRIGGRIVNGVNESWSELVGGGNLSITEILPGKVKVYFRGIDEGVKSKPITTILEGETEMFNGVEVYVKNVEINEVAHVSLIPEVKRTKTEANFTFRIGIEKRGIELSPEKTKRMLENINESIVRWEGIVDRLGNVVKGLKGACFATSTVLMVKNMVSGFSGGAMARQKVMAEYKVICGSSSEYETRTACYNAKSAEIEEAVGEMTSMYKVVNEDMRSVQEDNTGDSGGLLGGKGIINNTQYRKDLVGKIGSKKIEVDIGGEKKFNVSVDKSLSVSELQAVMLWEKSEGKGVVAREIAKGEMDAALRNEALEVKQNENNVNALKELEELGLKGVVVQSHVSKDVALKKWSEQFAEDGKTKIEYFNYDGRIYRLVLENSASGRMAIREAQLCSKNCGQVSSWKNVLNDEGNEDLKKELRKIVFSSEVVGSCSNEWRNDDSQVKYYDYGNNKGLPAIVPFGFPGKELNDGWYVWVKNSGGSYVDDSVQGYRASGDVRNFYICNIGPNGLMQTGTGDDLCQSFDVNTVGAVDRFISCPDIDVNKIYNRAREAIRQASSQYGEVTINIFDQMIKRGSPMSSVGGFECQDFMSPADCLLMFNVCDPVICPPSRCDLGGKMPVSNVIQTGIIGSLVLCLPNAKEGIKIPICLSGVHAGLESYLSILRSEADCLQHSLDTGELVGICDEITSIYKCEFFWRQLSPVMDQLLPSIVSSIISPGQRVRGGGEYALVQHSWNVMRQSVSYFKDVYAQNAFRAFNIRSTEEVGSTFCKAFIGTSVPSSANIIDSLLEPESPTQFYAQFSETLFTEATVPETSQYKVYYHIYAGNNKGVQYKVYLKNPPETSYYRANPSVQVKSGYIARGSSADESIDFTAPSGYKELCVVIDAREECGFRQVTTDFGLDYVKKKYVEEQAEKSDITTEKECISGSPSALSTVNLNLQAGVEEMANPEIALRGIVRVCASLNPGVGVVSEDYVVCKDKEDCGKGFDCSERGYCESEGVMQMAGSRWKDVGYCGDSSMRCWLDVESVEKDLGVLEAIEGSSISLLNERRDWIKNERLSLEQVQESLASVRGRIKRLRGDDLETPSSGVVGEIVLELDNIIGRSTLEGYEKDIPGAGTNRDRAEVLALKATVYRMVVVEAREGEVVKVVEGVVEEELEAGVDEVLEVEVKNEKVTWEDLMGAGLAVERNGARFIVVEGRGTLPIKGYDEDAQEILADDGGSVNYKFERRDGEIVFVSRYDY